MTAVLPAPPLLFITDRLTSSIDLRDVVRAVLDGGCRWIMVREKDLDHDALTRLAADIVTLAKSFGARVLVNGDLEAAAAAGAAGAHVQSITAIAAARKRLGDGALVGLSAHSVAEVKAAADAGADYATLSPIFLTESKPGYGPALGVAGLAVACSTTSCPVIALAGISPDNTAACLDAGAAGIAVMGGIMRAADPAKAVRDFLNALAAPRD